MAASEGKRRDVIGEWGTKKLGLWKASANKEVENIATLAAILFPKMEWLSAADGKASLLKSIQGLKKHESRDNIHSSILSCIDVLRDLKKHIPTYERLVENPADEDALDHFHYNQETDGESSDFVNVVHGRLLKFLKQAKGFGYIGEAEYGTALARIEAAQPSKVAAGKPAASTPETVDAAAADSSDVSTVPSSNSENRSAAAENAEETPTTTPSDTAVSVVGKLEALTDLETWKKDAAREIERIGQVIKELYPRHQWLTKGKPSLLSKIEACDSLKADLKLR